MARHKQHRKAHKKIPVLATTGLAVFALNAINEYRANGVDGLKWATLGVNKNGVWQADKFIANLTPPAAGIGGSMLAAKTGANRYISSVPMVKF